MPTGTVTVACKLPNGILLDVVGMPQVHITGIALDTLGGQMPRNPIRHGFSLTSGVPADFWEKWLSENQNSDLVKKGFIFAHEKPNEADARARDTQTIRTKLEPLRADDPANGVATDPETHRTGIPGPGNQSTVRVGSSPAISIR